jgi:predicted RNase H-like HicB family nuclease
MTRLGKALQRILEGDSDFCHRRNRRDSQPSAVAKWEGETVSGEAGWPAALEIQPRGDRVMNKYRYEMVLCWSDADQAYIAEVPDLPGCIADGATYVDAVKNAERIIGEWIETARALGRPIPEPRRIKTA